MEGCNLKLPEGSWLASSQGIETRNVYSFSHSFFNFLSFYSPNLSNPASQCPLSNSSISLNHHLTIENCSIIHSSLITIVIPSSRVELKPGTSNQTQNEPLRTLVRTLFLHHGRSLRSPSRLTVHLDFPYSPWNSRTLT